MESFLFCLCSKEDGSILRMADIGGTFSFLEKRQHFWMRFTSGKYITGSEIPTSFLFKPARFSAIFGIPLRLRDKTFLRKKIGYD